MCQEGKAIVGLQGIVSLGNKTKNIRMTNVSTPRHLIQQEIRQISVTNLANVAYLL
jgi:hypothetical protein